MKHFISKALIVALAFIISFYAVPAIASASSINGLADIMAQIQALEAKLKTLETQLNNQQTISWCYNFDANLGVGSSGNDVISLQTALSKEGFSVGVTGSYDENTASAVSGFQEKYAAEVLAPLGLQYGTGYVGPSTRNKLNSLYGCNQVGSGTNSAPSTSTTSTGPITITNVQFSPATPEINNWITTQVTVKNSGSVDQNTPFKIDVEGSTVSVPSLAAGAQTTVTISDAFTYSYPGPETIETSVIYPLGISSEFGNVGDTVSSTLVFASPTFSNSTSSIPTFSTSTQSITITSPNSGDAWVMGENHTITWTSVGLPSQNVGIYFWLNYGTMCEIGEAPLNAEKFTFSLQDPYKCTSLNNIAVAPGANVAVKIAATSDGTDNGSWVFSNAVPISIKSASPPTSRTILYIAPASASVGDTVYVYGSNFDQYSYVYFDGIYGPDATTTIISSGELSFIVPQLSSGSHMLWITDRVYGVTSNSATLNITAPPATVSQVMGLGAAYSGSNSVVLSWEPATASKGVGVYNIYRSATSGFTPSQSNLIAQGDVLSYVDSNLRPGTYYYAVAAQDTNGNIGQSSTQISATIAGAPGSGDVLGDGVTSADAVAVKQYLAGTRMFTTAQIAAAEVDGDTSKVTQLDAQIILDYLVRDFSSLPLMNIVWGDASGDGQVTIADSVVISQYIAGTRTLTPIEFISADVDKDGVVDSTDEQLIEDYLVGDIKSFPN